MAIVRDLSEMTAVPTLISTVALQASNAERARFAILNEHQIHDAHAFAMHADTGFSAHLITFVERFGSIQ